MTGAHLTGDESASGPGAANEPHRPTPAQQVVDRYLQMVEAGQWHVLADLYAHDAVVEHPFNPPGERWLRGRAALTRHFTQLADLGLQLRVDDLVTHHTNDPDTVISEFHYRGQAHGRYPVHRRNVFITTVHGGLISHSRDYQAEIAADDTTEVAARRP